MVKEIFVVYNGRVVSAPVVKETDQRFYINRCREYGYRTYVYKTFAHVTPIAAVQKEIKDIRGDIDAQEYLLDKLNTRLKAAEKLNLNLME